MTRDQQRAVHAYNCIAGVQDQKNYKIAVDGLGATILRSGLAAAMSGLERRGTKSDELRGHLAAGLTAAGLPGIGNVSGHALPERVRGLDVDSYMLATRETLQIVLWLKRAAQASAAQQSPLEKATTTEVTDAQ